MTTTPIHDEVEAEQEYVRALRVADRCDTGKCGAQAFAIADFPEGELFFCGHHFRRYHAELIAQGANLIDETRYINRTCGASA